jgi:glycosyltransferase involved in cell wall biosynthesis
MEQPPPLLSIITVVYNARELLEGTIRSVDLPRHPQLEYLVIDGASTDGTAELARNQAEAGRISRWISEPDKGLYDAMNKGLHMARGQFVWFLNAGDQVAETDTIERLLTSMQPEVDILYGEVVIVDEARTRLGTRSELSTQKLPASLHWKSLQRGMVVCHQAFIPRRSIAPNYMPGNLTADIDWVIRCLKAARKVVHTQLVLAEYLQGGISKQRLRQSLLDRYQVLRQHYGFWPNAWNHLLISLRALLRY